MVPYNSIKFQGTKPIMLFKRKVWPVLKDEKCLITAMPMVASYIPLPSRKQAQIHHQEKLKWNMQPSWEWCRASVGSFHKIKNIVFCKKDLDYGSKWINDFKILQNWAIWSCPFYTIVVEVMMMISSTRNIMLE